MHRMENLKIPARMFILNARVLIGDKLGWNAVDVSALDQSMGMTGLRLSQIKSSVYC